MEITLDMVDKVRERTGVGYKEAKEALEYSNGNVLDAIIFIEDMEPTKEGVYQEEFLGKVETIDEIKKYIKSLVEKGNVCRIKIKKEEEVLVDIPVNAGIAATVIAVILPPILAALIIAAVATKITIEITKTDGSVEVVNKYIAKAAGEVVLKTSDFAAKMKNKYESTKDSMSSKKGRSKNENDTIYSYTVNFDEDDK